MHTQAQYYGVTSEPQLSFCVCFYRETWNGEEMEASGCFIYLASQEVLNTHL